MPGYAILKHIMESDLFASNSAGYVRLLLIIVSLFLVFGAQAARVPGLYEAVAPVVSQNPSSRNPALREILRAVVTKVTGRNDLPSYFYGNGPAAGHLVEQFGYESTEQGGERQLFLWARLNPEGVKRIITEQGLPIWPEERPAALIWLAVEDEAGPQVIAEGSDHEAVTALSKIAAQRGLPIIMPLMDLAESTYIDFNLIAGLEGQTLIRASEKYASQHILIGLLQGQDGFWQGHWQVVGTEQAAAVTMGSLGDVIAAGINPLVNRITQQFSGFAPGDGLQYMDITVDDIRGAADYGRSLNYLRSLSFINQVDVLRVDRHGMNFRLHTRADIASVLRVIGTDRVLYARDTVDGLVFGLNPRGELQ